MAGEDPAGLADAATGVAEVLAPGGTGPEVPGICCPGADPAIFCVDVQVPTVLPVGGEGLLPLGGLTWAKVRVVPKETIKNPRHPNHAKDHLFWEVGKEFVRVISNLPP